jgi:UrcA family protein
MGLCLPFDILAPAMSGFPSGWCPDERHTSIWELNMYFSTQRKFGGNRLAVVFATLAMGVAGAANAVSLVGPDIKVNYSDLAIETEPGAATLLGRIEAAAKRICAPLDYGTGESRANVKACREKATAAAVLKVNHPMLRVVYARAKGIRPPVASLGR